MSSREDSMPTQDNVHAYLSHWLAQQKQAHRDHPFASLQERLDHLEALRRLLRDNRRELIEAVNADFGHRNRFETQMMEIAPVLAAAKSAQKNLKKWMQPQSRDVARHIYGFMRNQVRPEPLGVVGVIVPWNFPIMLSLSPLVSILAAGNRAIIKYSEHSMHLSALLQKLMPRYFDDTRVVVLQETGSVGEVLASMPLDHLIFTGSAHTARKVMQAAAQHLTPLTLELGGKSCALIAPDFDVHLACERILFGKVLNAGQVCISVDHVYVPRAKVPTFVACARALLQRWMQDLGSVDYSSIIHAQAFERLQAMLTQAQHGGAQLIPLLPQTAEQTQAHRLAPHLILDAPADCALMQEEIFGPLLPIIAYDDVHAVITHLQSQPKALAFYHFTHDQPLLQKMLDHVQSGGVTVNDVLLHAAQEDLPFGGVGASGMGHYHGYEGFLNFSKLRPVTRQVRWTPFNWVRPPYKQLMSKMAWWVTRLS